MGNPRHILFSCADFVARCVNEEEYRMLEGELDACKDMVQKPTPNPVVENSLSSDLQGVDG